MTDAPFRPFETRLDEAAALSILRAVAGSRRQATMPLKGSVCAR